MSGGSGENGLCRGPRKHGCFRWGPCKGQGGSMEKDRLMGYMEKVEEFIRRMRSQSEKQEESSEGEESVRKAMGVL